MFTGSVVVVCTLVLHTYKSIHSLPSGKGCDCPHDEGIGRGEDAGGRRIIPRLKYPVGASNNQAVDWFKNT